MMRSRLKKIASIAGAGAVATVGTLALNPFSASAAGTTTTATTVTGPSTVTTGHGVTLTAAVSPSKVTGPPVVKATGAVTFTITGSDDSSVPCANTPAVNGKGKATCVVAPGSLLAAASPYSVSAAYAGDTNFSASTGDFSVSVTAATAHVRLTVDSKPTSDSPSTFTATVTGGGGTAPTGIVTFTVASNGKPAKLVCSPGGKKQTLAPNDATPPVATATCALAAGWMKVSAKSGSSTSWTVVATYGGDGNFQGGASAKMSGTAKS
jgi:hypothetical protein